MKQVEKEQPLWFEQEISPDNNTSENTNSDGVLLSSCMPNNYQSYLKILHPIFEDLSIDNHDVTWNDCDDLGDLQQLSDEVKKILSESVSVYGSPDSAFPAKQVTWRELAERYGVNYRKEICSNCFTKAFPGRSWPRYLVGPEEGSLDENTCKELVNILSKIDSWDKCYFHFEVHTTRRCEADLLFIGKLHEVLDFIDHEDVYGTPTHWWPKDRSWFILTDWDLTFTVIAGNNNLTDSVHSSQLLESIFITPKTRVDWGA